MSVVPSRTVELGDINVDVYGSRLFFRTDRAQDVSWSLDLDGLHLRTDDAHADVPLAAFRQRFAQFMDRTVDMVDGPHLFRLALHPAHDQVWLASGVEVDSGICGLIIEQHARGRQTLASCENGGDGRAYIVFVESWAGRAFCADLKRDGFEPASVERGGRVVRFDPAVCPLHQITGLDLEPGWPRNVGNAGTIRIERLVSF